MSLDSTEQHMRDNAKELLKVYRDKEGAISEEYYNVSMNIESNMFFSKDNKNLVSYNLLFIEDDNNITEIRFDLNAELYIGGVCYSGKIGEMNGYFIDFPSDGSDRTVTMIANGSGEDDSESVYRMSKYYEADIEFYNRTKNLNYNIKAEYELAEKIEQEVSKKYGVPIVEFTENYYDKGFVLSEMVLLKEFRGTGLGKNMFTLLEEALLNFFGVSFIVGNVKGSSEKLRKYYEDLGFRETKLDDKDVLPCLIMHKVYN